MVTVLEYMLIAVLVGVGLFGISVLVFGRNEELGPLPIQASPTTLPADSVRPEDVRKLKFQVRLRGYDMREVDWALYRLAEELESLRAKTGEPSALPCGEAAEPVVEEGASR